MTVASMAMTGIVTSRTMTKGLLAGSGGDAGGGVVVSGGGGGAGASL